jgi:hypothetical protein
MAGYATLGRVEGGRVRTLAWRGPATEVAHEPWPPSTPAATDHRRPLREVIHERWQDARETWAITTFYLFDPQSWR